MRHVGLAFPHSGVQALSATRRESTATMTVGKLAAQADLPPHVVRHYLRIGLLRANRRSSGGYQLFGTMELHRLRFIRVSQSLGFTLTEVGEIIRRSRRAESPCPLVRDLISQRIDETGDELDRMGQTMRTMRKATLLWARMPDSIPTGNEVCRLIEAVAKQDASLAMAVPRGGVARTRRIRIRRTRKRS